MVLSSAKLQHAYSQVHCLYMEASDGFQSHAFLDERKISSETSWDKSKEME